MIRRKLVTRPNKRKLDPSTLAYGTDATATLTRVDATHCRVTLNMPCVVSGVFALSVPTIVLSNQVIESQTSIKFTTSGDVAAKDWSIPARDPAVRTGTGGYVAAATGTFP